MEIAAPVARYLDRKNGRKYLEKVLKLEKDIDDEEHQTCPDDRRLHGLYSDLSKILRIMGSEVDRETA